MLVYEIGGIFDHETIFNHDYSSTGRYYTMHILLILQIPNSLKLCLLRVLQPLPKLNTKMPHWRLCIAFERIKTMSIDITKDTTKTEEVVAQQLSWAANDPERLSKVAAQP